MGKHSLEKGSYRIIPIYGDGLCCYQAIVNQRRRFHLEDIDEGEDIQVHRLKRDCVRALVECYKRGKNADFGYDLYEGMSFKRYIQAIISGDEYGGEIELTTISKLLKQHIMLYMDDPPIQGDLMKVVNYGEEYGYPTIRIHFIPAKKARKNHYNAIEWNPMRSPKEHPSYSATTRFQNDWEPDIANPKSIQQIMEQTKEAQSEVGDHAIPPAPGRSLVGKIQKSRMPEVTPYGRGNTNNARNRKVVEADDWADYHKYLVELKKNESSNFTFQDCQYGP